MTSYRNSDPRPPIMQGSPPAQPVPRIDWDRPPWNRWAFQHIRELMPTVEVWRGDAPVVPLPRAEQDAERDFDTLAVTLPDGTPGTLATLLDETYTDGFLVMKDGAVVAERYFNGMAPHSLHLSQSVAKSVTGTVAGILVGQGVLDPDAPLTDLIPELATTGWNGASLRHVLDMTSGTAFDESYADRYSDIGQVDVASGWKPVPEGSDPAFRWPPDIWSLILGLDNQTRPHGTRFEYRSIETDVLAFAMERATGRRLAQLVSEELWQKIGAERDACFTVDPAGYALADGGFNACLRDYARLGQAWLDGDIVPPAWIADSRGHATAEIPPAAMEGLSGGSYRNTMWNIGDGSVLMARGVFGQLIWIDFENAVVAAKLSSWPDFLSPALDAATRAAIQSITRALK
ncbi:serine hydrolase domain-containing protein [Acidimangrovimonas sediminis]|uniref:serine hydrolase domain-containing protein n=1 Tax=Acidimangrovimonas sediminis TaxID=2056283 RepID=UPI000C80E436|nr:serine hydrolase [Acidimangrovimonas sediminis]